MVALPSLISSCDCRGSVFNLLPIPIHLENTPDLLLNARRLECAVTGPRNSIVLRVLCVVAVQTCLRWDTVADDEKPSIGQSRWFLPLVSRVLQLHDRRGPVEILLPAT